jgi:predicted DNA binding CopG/RHH family protein
MKKKSIILSQEEESLLRSVESGEWESVDNLSQAKEEAKKIAANTLRKDARINIRLQQADLDRIKQLAKREGLPYQTLIASVLHKYAAGYFSENV